MTLNLQPIYVPFLFQGAFKKLAAGQQTLGDFLQGSDYALNPTTDDRPFFFDLSNDLPEGLSAALWVSVLLLAAVLALVLLLRESPTPARGRRSGAVWVLGAYVALLGLGFMCVEVPVIQRCILILGTPVLSLTVVLGTLLLAGGAGSFLSPRIFGGARRAAIAPCATALVVLVIGLVLFPSLPSLLLPVGTAGTLVALTILLTPLGLLLGMPFPLGMQLAARGAARRSGAILEHQRPVLRAGLGDRRDGCRGAWIRRRRGGRRGVLSACGRGAGRPHPALVASRRSCMIRVVSYHGHD